MPGGRASGDRQCPASTASREGASRVGASRAETVAGVRA